jgi:hypothetical protein
MIGTAAGELDHTEGNGGSRVLPPFIPDWRRVRPSLRARHRREGICAAYRQVFLDGGPLHLSEQQSASLVQEAPGGSPPGFTQPVAQAGSPEQSESSQSVAPSPSLSTPSVQFVSAGPAFRNSWMLE